MERLFANPAKHLKCYQVILSGTSVVWYQSQLLNTPSTVKAVKRFSDDHYFSVSGQSRQVFQAPERDTFPAQPQFCGGSAPSPSLSKSSVARRSFSNFS